MKKQTILTAQNIVKYYDNQRVLNAIDLEIRAGTVLALMGPNGSGKTTLIKILSSLEEADRGEVYYQGELINKDNSLNFRRQIGFIWQKTLLYNASVYNNVALGLKFRNYSEDKIKDKVDSTLDRLGIVDLKERNAKSLSGGQQQKVSIARTLVTDPQIIFVDEPNTSLDLESIELVEKIIKEKSQAGVPIVLITHNFYQAKNLGDEIIFLKEGEKVTHETPEEFFEQREELLRYV